MGFLGTPWARAALADDTFTLPPPPPDAADDGAPVLAGVDVDGDGVDDYPDPVTAHLARIRAERFMRTEAEAIPAVRKALHFIVGTITGWPLVANDRAGRVVAPESLPWLAQPDPAVTLPALLSRTLRDGIWHDRAYWRPVPGGWRRVNPARVVPIPADDPDDPPTYTLDGQPAPRLMVFDWAGFGGIERLGAPLLQIMNSLMAATSRYADDPVPSTVLKNTGRAVSGKRATQIVQQWETLRRQYPTGFLNAYMDLETVGYSARDLQLVETMEAVTKDVARMFGLPGRALGVDEGSSMTYANITDARRDQVEALRPWSNPIPATLSMLSYRVTVTDAGVSAVRSGRYVPLGTQVRFFTDDYLRESMSSRIQALTQAISTQAQDGALMTLDEARAIEPLVQTTA